MSNTPLHKGADPTPISKYIQKLQLLNAIGYKVGTTNYFIAENMILIKLKGTAWIWRTYIYPYHKIFNVSYFYFILRIYFIDCKTLQNKLASAQLDII